MVKQLVTFVTVASTVAGVGYMFQINDISINKWDELNSKNQHLTNTKSIDIEKIITTTLNTTETETNVAIKNIEQLKKDKLNNETTIKNTKETINNYINKVETAKTKLTENNTTLIELSIKLNDAKKEKEIHDEKVQTIKIEIQNQKNIVTEDFVNAFNDLPNEIKNKESKFEQTKQKKELINPLTKQIYTKEELEDQHTEITTEEQLLIDDKSKLKTRKDNLIIEKTELELVEKTGGPDVLYLTLKKEHIKSETNEIEAQTETIQDRTIKNEKDLEEYTKSMTALEEYKQLVKEISDLKIDKQYKQEQINKLTELQTNLKNEETITEQHNHKINDLTKKENESNAEKQQLTTQLSSDKLILQNAQDQLQKSEDEKQQIIKNLETQIQEKYQKTQTILELQNNLD